MSFFTLPSAEDLKMASCIFFLLLFLLGQHMPGLPTKAKNLVVSFLETSVSPRLPTWAPTRIGVNDAVQAVLAVCIVFFVASGFLVVGFLPCLWSCCRFCGSMAGAALNAWIVDHARRADLLAHLDRLDSERNMLVDRIEGNCLQVWRELHKEASDYAARIRRELPQEFQKEFLERIRWVDAPKPFPYSISRGRNTMNLPSRFQQFLFRHDVECIRLEHKIDFVNGNIAALKQQLRDIQNALQESQQWLDDDKDDLRILLAKLQKQVRVNPRVAEITMSRNCQRMLRTAVLRTSPLRPAMPPTAVVTGPPSREVVPPASTGFQEPVFLDTVGPRGLTLTVPCSPELAPTVDASSGAANDLGPEVRQEQQSHPQQQQVLMTQEEQDARVDGQLALASQNRQTATVQYQARVQFRAQVAGLRASVTAKQMERDMDALALCLANMSLRNPAPAFPPAAAAVEGPEVDMLDGEIEAPVAPASAGPSTTEIAQPSEDAPLAAPQPESSSDQLPPLPEDNDGDANLVNVPVPVAQPATLTAFVPVPSVVVQAQTAPAAPVQQDIRSATFTFDMARQIPAAPSPSTVSTLGTGGPRFSDAFLASASPCGSSANAVVHDVKGKGKATAVPAKVEVPVANAAANVLDDIDETVRLLDDEDLAEMEALLELALQDEENLKSAASSSAPAPVAPAPTVPAPVVPAPIAPAPAARSFAAEVEAQDQGIWDALADTDDSQGTMPAPATAPPAPVPAHDEAPAQSSIPPPGRRRIIAPRRRIARAAVPPQAAEQQVSPAPSTTAIAPQQSVTPTAPAAASSQHPHPTGSRGAEPRSLHQFEMAALVAKRADSVTRLALAMLADSYDHHVQVANEVTPDELRQARDNISERLPAIMATSTPAVAGTFECTDCDEIMDRWVHQHPFCAGSRVAEAERRIIDSMKKGKDGAKGKFRRRYLRFAGWTGY